MINVEVCERDVAEWVPFTGELEAVTSPQSRWRRSQQELLQAASDLLEVGLVGEPEAVAVELECATPESGSSQPLDCLISAATRALLEGRLGEAEGLRAIALLAETCALLGDERGAAILHDLLKHHANRFGADGWIAHGRGSISRHLALLAHELGRHDEAIDLFDDAVTANERTKATPTTRELPRNVWRKDGDFWTIGFEGREIHLKDTNGLIYIRELLRHPAREFHVADLSALAEGHSARDESRSPLLVERDVGPILDPEARDAYRQRLRDLQDELDDATAQADLGRAESARREMEIIEHELTAAYGLGGRARRASDPTERLRKAVTNQIRRALAKIGDAHPDLQRHLQRAIRTGFRCSYTPDLRITWIF